MNPTLNWRAIAATVHQSITHKTLTYAARRTYRGHFRNFNPPRGVEACAHVRFYRSSLLRHVPRSVRVRVGLSSLIQCTQTSHPLLPDQCIPVYFFSLVSFSCQPQACRIFENLSMRETKYRRERPEASRKCAETWEIVVQISSVAVRKKKVFGCVPLSPPTIK